MLDRYLEQHGDRFVSELRELCAIPSEATDPRALDAAARWCGERLVSAGAESHELRIEGAPALVVGETGAGKRTLICVQHYDVQPAVPLDLWQSPPYDPAVRDGAVYARGVDDNKGHLLLRVQAVEAYRAIHGELPLRVRFLIEGEEESGSSNLAQMLALDATLTDGDGALKEGGAIDASGRPQLLLGGKGIFYVELRVRTMARDAHSGAATHLPNAAWRLVNLIRTFCDELEVLIPLKALSAGTLISLGADKIVMTKQAALGPIDPSVNHPLSPTLPSNQLARVPVSVEAVRGYLDVITKEMKITDPAALAGVIVDLSNKVHPLVLGEIFRSRAQIRFLADKLIKRQVTDSKKIKQIIDFLCADSGSHDYTMNRREAAELGLRIEKPSSEFYEVLRKAHLSYAAEMKLRGGSTISVGAMSGISA